MPIKKKTEPSAFFLSFVGEYVQVVTSFQMLTEENPDVSLPLIIEGIIMDADDTYIYMGSEVDGIKQAVRCEYVVFVQQLNKAADLEDLLFSSTKVKKRDMN